MGLVLSLAIFLYVHQDSMHQAILSKCITSEFLQSLQSSDKLKMYAWMEIILVYIIIITLKGNSYRFKRGELFLRIIFLKNFNISVTVLSALKTSSHYISGHLAPVFCIIRLRCQDTVCAFWQSLKGHSQCIKNVFFLTDIKMWPLNDSCYQGSWTRKSIGCSWRGGINAGQIDHSISFSSWFDVPAIHT